MHETSDFFYSIITFSYTKYFVHSYTVDVVFTLSYCDIRMVSQDIGLRICQQSHPLLNMNIEGNIQRHVMTSLMTSKWFHFTQFASFHLWSQIEAIMYKIWTSKIPGNGFNFDLRWYFKANRNRNVSVFERCPVIMAIFLHAVPYKMTKWQF